MSRRVEWVCFTVVKITATTVDTFGLVACLIFRDAFVVPVFLCPSLNLAKSCFANNTEEHS